MLSLTSERFEQIQHALEKAFTSHDALHSFVQIRLDGVYTQVSQSDALSDWIEGIVREAERGGVDTVKSLLLATYLEYRIGELKVIANSIDNDWFDCLQGEKKVLDAAIHKEIKFGEATILLVLLRREDSKGLMAILEVEPDYGLDRGDVKSSKSFKLKYQSDEQGRLLPLSLNIVVKAPDFTPSQQIASVTIDPCSELDAELVPLEFILTPLRTGVMRVIVSVYYQDMEKQVGSKPISTLCLENPSQIAQFKVISMLMDTLSVSVGKFSYETQSNQIDIKGGVGGSIITGDENTIDSTTFNQQGQVIHGNQVNIGGETTIGHVAGEVNAIIGGDATIGHLGDVINQYTEIIVNYESIEDVPPTPGEPPYKGLAYFTEKDKDIFFGRETLSEQLTERLHTTNFLTLIGASGSGKSSLLRAGVIPRLRTRNWLIHVMKPGVHPLRALANSLTREDEGVDSAENVQKTLTANPDTLHKIADKLIARHEAERLLLAIDQFEELFTQCKDIDEQNAFVENLTQTVAAQGATTILIAMRADFYNRVSEFSTLTDLVSQQQIYVKPLAEEDLVRVIAEPARRGGWQFVKGLVEAIVEDVGQEPGRLPLLSHALLETWKRRRTVIMTLRGYHDAGRVKGAIAKTADATLAQLQNQNPDLIEITREIFLDLTELGDGAENTRRVASRDELSVGVDDTALDTVLETLIRARLITVSDGEVEVAHEALIRRWPQLQEWLADHRDRLRFERQLARDADEWYFHNQDQGFLYRGARLAQASEFTDSHEIQLTNATQAFLRTSLESEQREIERVKQQLTIQRRLTQRTRILLVVVSAIAVALAVNPVRNYWWRLQAMADSELIMVPHMEVYVGLCRQEETFTAMQGIFCSAETGNTTPITVPSFAIEKFEVTNQQYRFCRQAGSCLLDPSSQAYFEEAMNAYPVQGVTAFQAHAYCRWLDRDLPTELQWEYALNQQTRTHREHILSPASTVIHTATVPIATTSNPPIIVNMMANVSEWTRSFTWSGDSPYILADMVWDGTQISLNRPLIVRGDSFLETNARQESDGNDTTISFGFRCVKDSP